MDKVNHGHLNTLKEMILDEKKLVSYISLSREMCLHVNECKSLLSQLVQELKDNNAKDITLNITYMISGLLDGNKAKTLLCSENDLVNMKNQFKVVFYQHIYSVCSGSSKTDTASFMAIHRFEDFPLCTGMIRSNTCVKRSSEEIGTLKINSQDSVVNEHKPNIAAQRKVKEEKSTEKSGVSVTKPTPISKPQQIKLEPIVKAESKSPKKSMNLQKPDHKNVKAQKGIAGFFNKPATNSKKGLNDTVPKQNIREESNSKKEEKSDKIDNSLKSEKIKIEQMDVDQDEPNERVTEKFNGESSEKKANKSLNQIKKTAKLDKKRKRVLHVSDSESEDEKNDPFSEDPVVNQESDDEIPPTPLVKTVKITSGIINPKKRRKIVDKTYTDEDGYILTKKEEVYESCSENEDEVHVKENIQQENKVKVEVSPPSKKTSLKNGKKKLASPQKGKQSTLMSFFKKA